VLTCWAMCAANSVEKHVRPEDIAPRKFTLIRIAEQMKIDRTLALGAQTTIVNYF